jgi:hypothetical protein
VVGGLRAPLINPPSIFLGGSKSVNSWGSEVYYSCGSLFWPCVPA